MKRKNRILTLVISLYVLIACAGAGTYLYLNHGQAVTAMKQVSTQPSKENRTEKEADTRNKETQEVAQAQQTLPATEINTESETPIVTTASIEATTAATDIEQSDAEQSDVEESNGEEAKLAAEEADVEADQQVIQDDSGEKIEITTQPGKEYNATITGASYVNVRTGPKRGDHAVGCVSRGTKGKLVSTGAYCSYVKFPHMEGYVYNLYLQVE